MDFMQYKCPCCGSALTFSPKTQKLSCQNCDNEYDIQTLERFEADNQAASDEDLHWQYQNASIGAKRTDDGLYICPSCGAEIEADENTVSTHCPYCDNVVIIKPAAEGEFKPDAIIPFKVSGDTASTASGEFLQGKTPTS